MTQGKQTVVTAFALFSLFFGAGNLILPPFLGYNAGESWLWVTLGFAVSAVLIPILAIYGHARLQGTMLDFANKVTPGFAIFYSICVYAISISLPSPRTASVTYEMAIQPYFEMSSLTLSTLYFAVVLIFVLNRTKIISIIGKFLTPLIILLLVAVVLIGLFSELEPMKQSLFTNSFTAGILEGYQTFDAIGGVVVGGVIIISFNLQGKFDAPEKRKMIGRAGLIAGIGLFVIYGGLIALGASHSGTVTSSNRTELLQILSTGSLGSIGTAFLGVLVTLACFTTAVGIVTGTADFVKGLLKDSQLAYIITAVLGCILGVAVGQWDVHYIIDIALPALMFIYPITIVLILLNVTPKKLASQWVFRTVVIVTFLFSIPDFLGFLIAQEQLQGIRGWLPFANDNMGWILPALITFVITNVVLSFRKKD
ncbi:MAG: branched-chain amino acid transport system II carrier protein [Flavobacteriaceae bacterium]|nr:branched-chain amino acid transport system II carrier protein [Flavobacteriaceae bacterium]